MAKLIINTGTSANDGTGDPLRNAGAKLNANFDEIYNSIGNGTAIQFFIDFSSTQPSEGDSLVFNSGTSRFEPSSIVNGLDDLNDVSLGVGPSDGDLLRYNGATGVFEPTVLNLAQLDDVDTQGVTDGQILKFSEATGKFEPASDLSGGGSGGGIVLTDLSVNVQLPGTANLVYNNSTGVFSYTPPDLSDFALTANIPTTILDLDIIDGVDGQVLTTDGSGNFSFVSLPLEQNTITTVSADSGSFSADEADTFITIEGGKDITTSITDNILTIDFTGNTFVENAIATLRVNNVGADAYTFDSHYSGNNPTIYALSGTTIAFDLSEISGHPFEIQTDAGTPFSDNLVHVADDGTILTGSDAQGQDSGTLYWRIPEPTSGEYQYVCQVHGAMSGTIQVKRLSTL